MARARNPINGLDLSSIEKKVQNLEQRLSERFQLDAPPNEPHAESLREKVRLIQELIKVLPLRVRKFRRPRVFLRIFFLVVTLGLVGGANYLARKFNIDTVASSVSDLMQGVQAAEALLVAIGLGLYTLFSIERRSKRKVPIRDLAMLRSLAHDIHQNQNDVDPDRLVRDSNMNTPTSPKLEFSPFTMCRFLDYCAEALSHIGSCAAYYNENCPDPDVQRQVDGIETLTNNLSLLLGQKSSQITQLFELSIKQMIMQDGTSPAQGFALNSTILAPQETPTAALVTTAPMAESPAASLKSVN